MNLLGSVRKYSILKTAVVFVLAGVVLVAVSILGITKDRNSSTVYAETEATIVSATETRITEDEYEYSVLVNYEVNGVAYENIEYGSYSSSMKPGDKITVLYNTADPADIRVPGSGKVPYVVGALGLAAVAAGLAILVKGLKTKSKDLNEYDRVDTAAVSPETVEAIRTSTEAAEKYVFRFDRRIRQGYLMKDANGETVYEAKMQKLTVLKPFAFDFCNGYTKDSATHLIGHTVTFSAGSGLAAGFSYRVPITKKFTVDGQSNWDFLAENGWSFDFTMQGIAPCFNVKHWGVPVAFVKTAGTDAMTGRDTLIGKLPVNGIYSVECRRSDIDMVFMVCFSIARAIFYAK